MPVLHQVIYHLTVRGLSSDVLTIEICWKLLHNLISQTHQKTRVQTFKITTNYHQQIFFLIFFASNQKEKFPFFSSSLDLFSRARAALKLHLNILCLQKFIFGIPVARNIRDEWINTRQNFKRKVNELLENRLGGLGRCNKCKTEIKVQYVCKKSSFSYLGRYLLGTYLKIDSSSEVKISGCQKQLLHIFCTSYNF